MYPSCFKLAWGSRCHLPQLHARLKCEIPPFQQLYSLLMMAKPDVRMRVSSPRLPKACACTGVAATEPMKRNSALMERLIMNMISR